MANKQKPPVVVAELGRPETSSETAARKARDSRLYRQRKTVNNLVFSLLVSLGLVLVIVLVVPRGADTWSRHSVDVAGAATQNAASAGVPLVAPETPEGWLPKQAELRTSNSGDILYWYIGYTTASGAYAATVQAFTESGAPVDEEWIAQQLESQAATGTDAFGGHAWTVYDHQNRSPDQANMLYGLRTDLGRSALLVYGTDSADALRGLAEAAVAPGALKGGGSAGTTDSEEAE
jgi:hypothetical protein